MAPLTAEVDPVRGKRSDGSDDGTDHHSGHSSMPTSSNTSSGPPAPTGVPASQDSQSNTGAIAGGTIGAVAAVAAIMGLLWWWWRKRTFGKRVYKEKPEIDPDDTVPVPATLLAVPATAHPPSDSDPSTGLATAPVPQGPRHWQVHNASSPSLQNAVPAEKSAKAALLSIPSTPSDPFSSPTLSSPTSSSAPWSHHGHSTTEDGTAPTTMESTSAESEIADLRRRVTLLTQENARLSAAQNIMGVPTGAEAPPAYDPSRGT